MYCLYQKIQANNIVYLYHKQLTTHRSIYVRDLCNVINIMFNHKHMLSMHHLE